MTCTEVKPDQPLDGRSRQEGDGDVGGGDDVVDGEDNTAPAGRYVVVDDDNVVRELRDV